VEDHEGSTCWEHHRSLRRELSESANAASDRETVRQRRCLKCRAQFISAWIGERVCQDCKRLQDWRLGGSWQADDGKI
jgi:hypothetical protein